MESTIKLGRIWGVPIGLHFSWFLIFALMAWSLALGYFPGEYPMLSPAAHWFLGGMTSLLFFGSVLLHELGHTLPGLGEQPLASDVSGADVGPVPRYPGLVRSYFAREGQAAEVRYAGRAAFDTVLAHYVQGFAAAGYAQEVVSATPEAEQHRFRRGQESIDLALTRRPGELVEVGLKQLSP